MSSTANSFHQIKYRPHDWLVIRMASLKLDVLEAKDFKTADDVLMVPEFKKMMWACQPQLMQKFTENKLHGSAEAIRDIFLKYLLRSVSSSIPRKMFAGYNLAQLGAGFQIAPKTIEHWNSLQVKTPEKPSDSYFFNPSLYFASGYIHLKSWNSVEKSFVDHAMRLTNSGTAVIQSLSEHFTKSMSHDELKKNCKKFGVGAIQFEEFFNWLLQLGVLLTEPASKYKVTKKTIVGQMKQSDKSDEMELHIEFENQPIVDSKFVLKAASAATDLIQILQVQMFLSMTRSSISEFKRSAAAYLSGREVPLLELVDTHSEVFFKKMNLRVAHEESNATALIQAKVIESLSQKQTPVLLSKEDMNEIKDATIKQWPQLESQYRFPHSVSVFVEKGPNELPFLRRIEGGSFLGALSRYAYYNPDIAAALDKSFENLKSQLTEKVVYAVPSYVDFSGQFTGILQAHYPKIHVIRINEPCQSPGDLPLSDLLVTLDSGGFILKSKSLQKKVIVIAGHLLNEGLISDITFDFLHSLGLHQSFKTMTFSAFSFRIPYTPRIEIPSAILSLAVWKFWGSNLKKIAALDGERLKLEFIKHRIPTKFNWMKADQKIFIDLDKNYLREHFQSEIKKHQEIVLEEFIEPESGRATDFIIPLFLESAKVIQPMTNESNVSESIPDNQYLSMNEEILSLEIYLSSKNQHEFLKHQMPKLIGDQKFYFFIRYSDLFEGFHFRLRIKNSPKKLQSLVMQLIKKLELLQTKNQISHYKLVPFTPEYLRYGGKHGMNIFYQESMWQSQLILAAAKKSQLETSEDRKKFATLLAKVYFDKLKTIGLEPQKVLRDKLKRRNSSASNLRPVSNHQNDASIQRASPCEVWIQKYLNQSNVQLIQNLKKMKFKHPTEIQDYFHSYIHMLLNRCGASFHVDQDEVILKSVLQLLNRSEHGANG